MQSISTKSIIINNVFSWWVISVAIQISFTDSTNNVIEYFSIFLINHIKLIISQKIMLILRTQYFCLYCLVKFNALLNSNHKLIKVWLIFQGNSYGVVLRSIHTHYKFSMFCTSDGRWKWILMVHIVIIGFQICT